MPPRTASPTARRDARCHRAHSFISRRDYAPAPVDIVARWMDLVRSYPVTGQTIFDVQLVATMLAHDVRTVYTYNRVDFEAFAQITIRTPGQND